MYDGGTVAGVMAKFSDTFGVPISGGTAEPIGLVHFEESGIYFLDNIGRYAGGWCLEDQEGNWSFTRWNDTASRSPEVALTLAHAQTRTLSALQSVKALFATRQNATRSLGSLVQTRP